MKLNDIMGVDYFFTWLYGGQQRCEKSFQFEDIYILFHGNRRLSGNSKQIYQTLCFSNSESYVRLHLWPCAGALCCQNQNFEVKLTSITALFSSTGTSSLHHLAVGGGCPPEYGTAIFSVCPALTVISLGMSAWLILRSKTV